MNQSSGSDGLTYDARGILTEDGSSPDQGSPKKVEDVTILGPLIEGYEGVLSNAAMQVLKEMSAAFGERISGLPSVEESTGSGAGSDDWKVLPISSVDRSRKVVLYGPAFGAGLIRGLNSDADAYIASVDGYLAPSWPHVVEGQAQLRDAVSGTLTYRDPKTGDFHTMNNLSPPKVIFQPRALEVLEKHIDVGGTMLSAGLMDVVLFVYHNGEDLLHQQGSISLSLSGLSSVAMAEAWRDILAALVERFTFPAGAFNVTIEMGSVGGVRNLEGILFALKESAGAVQLSDRDLLVSLAQDGDVDEPLPSTMGPDPAEGPLHAIAENVVAVAHQHGALAMGPAMMGCPGSDGSDPVVHEGTRALTTVYGNLGFDGVGVARATLIPTVRNALDAIFQGENKLDRAVEKKALDEAALKLSFTGEVSTKALGDELGVSLRFLANWLTGEDVFVADGRVVSMSCAELTSFTAWQWWTKSVSTNEGEATKESIRSLLSAHVAGLRDELGDELYRAEGFGDARAVLRRSVGDEDRGLGIGARAYAKVENTRE